MINPWSGSILVVVSYSESCQARYRRLGTIRSTTVCPRLVGWTETTVSLATINHLLSSDRLVAAAILCVLNDFVAHPRRDSQSNNLLINIGG